MSEPWLETWEVTEGKGLVSIDNPVEQILLGATVDMQHIILAAAAPDMCRALLAVEYAKGEDGYDVCPRCGGKMRSIEVKHYNDCALDAALTKAGLATQEQRDAARKKLGI